MQKSEVALEVPEPQSLEELKVLVDTGVIEIISSSDQDDGTTRLLVGDKRINCMYELFV